MMMTLTNIKQIAMPVCCTVMLWGCNDAENIIPEQENIPITFKTPDNWGDYVPQSKAAHITENTTTDNLNTLNNQINVTAFYLQGGRDNTELFPNFMCNEKLTYNGSTWEYSPLKYWPTATKDRLRFFAYWPYGDERVVPSDKDTKGYPTLKYDAPDADLDLLGADTKLVAYNEGQAQELAFKHLLTKVNFTFKREKGEYAFHPLVYMVRFPIPWTATYHFAESKWKSGDIDLKEVNAEEVQAWSEGKMVTRYTEPHGIAIVDEDKEYAISDFTCYVLPYKLRKFEVVIDNIVETYVHDEYIELEAGKEVTLNFSIKPLGGKKFILTFTLWEEGDIHFEGDLK